MSWMKTKAVSADKVKEVRQRAYKWGVFAERIAIGWLLLKGYHILKRRYRNSHGEVDIIAKRRSIIVFIEVKARRSKEEAAESIHPRQKMRIENTAKGFIIAHPEYIKKLIRFDVICCAPWQKPLHIEDAWRPLS